MLTHGIYFTVGEDDYWLRHAEKTFRSLLPSDSFSLHVFDKVYSFADLLSALDTYGFSGDDNVVIVKDTDYKMTEADKEVLKNAVCDQGYLLFIKAKCFTDKKGDKKSGVCFTSDEKKLFNCINCDKSDKFSCARQAEKLFPYGIDRQAANLLAEFTNCDMARISVEAEKLSAYKQDKITVADVTELVVEDTDLQIFMFVNSIIDGKTTLAMKQLARLKKRGEGPSLLLAALISQYRRMFYASLSPLSDKELADMFKVKEFAIKKVRENRKISKKQLKATLEMLVSYEHKFKSGVMSEQTAFDAAIMSLVAQERL